MAKKTKFEIIKSKLKIAILFPYILIFFGLTGLIASTTINIEKTTLLQHPKSELICDLNPVYSCGNVITSKQSKTFGVSNELYGMALFSGILATGIMVAAGAKPKKWFWQSFMLAMFGFMLFVVYLWTQSVYVIKFLCVLCTSVWFSGWAITMSLYSWLFDQKVFKNAPKKLHETLWFVRRNNLAVWAGVIAILVGFTLKHFWYYYGPHLGF